MSQYGRWSGNSSGGGGGTVTTVTASTPLASSGGTTPDISIQTASGSQAGALSAADWTTFNSKGSGTVTNVSGTAPIVSSGGATPAISIPTATSLIDGALSAADWTTFNGKQAAGSYITSLTGGVTASGPGASAATVVTNANLTGPITSTGNATAVASQTGTGSTFVMDTSPTLVTPNLGTPTTLVGTNISGTASGLTAGNVTTNANLTGDVTSVGNATTLTNAPVIAKVLTGYTSGAGTISSSDSILSAIQKLNGNAPGVSSTAKVIYVSQDTGNDSNSGTIYSPLKTIQAGINAANAVAAYYAQVVVLVTPPFGTSGYNENITFSQQGVVLRSASSLRGDACLLTGSVTVNLTGTAGGVNYIAASNIVYIQGFNINNTSGDAIIFSGTAFQRLILNNCYIQSTTAGSCINMTNTGVNGVPSTITARDCDFENNSATLATFIVGAGRLFISGAAPFTQNDNAAGPSFNITGANAAGPTVTGNNIDITGQMLVSDNTANVTLSSYIIRSGSLPAIVTASSPNTGVITIGTGALQTSATNSITGSGVVVPGGENAKVSSGGDIISTVTQVTLAKFPEGQTLLGAGSTAVTNSLLIVKNGHLTSQQSTAPTSALQTGAGNTATRTLTRCTDTAGNISIAVAGTGIAAGAQLIVTFNKAYATAPVVTLTPTNVNSSLVIGAYVTSSTTTFTINFAAAGTTGTTYAFTYQVIET